WACSSQASVRSKSYFFLSSDRGGSLSSHMPSSARTRATGFRTSQSRANDRTANKDERCLTLAPPPQSRRAYLPTAARHDKPFPIGHLRLGRNCQFRVGCPPIQDWMQGGAMNNAVVIRGQIRIPEWVKDLDSFHRWTESPDYPESGWFSYFRGEIWVDTSM